MTEAPSIPTEMPAESASSLEGQMSRVDSALRQTLEAAIAYNKPESMKLDETVTVELLLNPSLSPEVLTEQVDEPGQVQGAKIQVTPRMKALLIVNDDEAFILKPIHDNAEQIISADETTRWAWLVTAKKGGRQSLTMVVYRLVEYDGKGYWREVESYKTDVNIQVTFFQRVQSWDWGWFAGILITAIAVPAFWRWIDRRKKQKKK